MGDHLTEQDTSSFVAMVTKRAYSNATESGESGTYTTIQTKVMQRCTH